MISGWRSSRRGRFSQPLLALSFGLFRPFHLFFSPLITFPLSFHPSLAFRLSLCLQPVFPISLISIRHLVVESGVCTLSPSLHHIHRISDCSYPSTFFFFFFFSLCLGCPWVLCMYSSRACLPFYFTHGQAVAFSIGSSGAKSVMAAYTFGKCFPFDRAGLGAIDQCMGETDFAFALFYFNMI